VSVDTEHTLVHYLYTGTYQALGAKGEDSRTSVPIKFKEALLVFSLASTYELPDLEKLAKEQIKRYGNDMALVEVLDTAREEFSKMTRGWFHEYLQFRAEEQFELDYAFFTSKAYIESVGEGTLHRFMTCHLLEIFSNKLTHTLQRRGSRRQNVEESDIVLDEVDHVAVQTHHCSCCSGRHERNMSIAGDDMSFEFPNASCGDIDDVRSLESSLVPDCVVPESPIEGISHLKVFDIQEEQAMHEEAILAEQAMREEEELTVEALPAEVEEVRLAKEAEEEARLVEEEEAAEAEAARLAYEAEEAEAEAARLAYEAEEARLAAEVEEARLAEEPEITPEASSTLCPRRFQHLSKGTRWQSCEQCRTLLKGIAVQIAKENKTILLSEVQGF
jgi:hypothetical protein